MEILKLSYEEIGALCTNLAMLLHAGTGTADALSLLAEDTAEPKLKNKLKAMAEEADGGTPLTALFAADASFPTYLSTMLEVGEKTGHTEEALQGLAEYYYNQARLSNQLRDALVYPSILLVIMLLVVGVLLVRVLPIFDEVYRQLGTSLTGVAGGLLKLGGALKAVLPFLTVVLLAVVVFVLLFANSESFRNKVVLWWRKRRGDKGLSREISCAHFTQAFAMGLASGMPTDEAVELSARVLSDVPAAKKHCDDVLSQIGEGKPLPEALAETGLMPAAESRLLATALRSGSGEESVRAISARLTEKSERSLRRAVSRIEPALVIAGCLMVGLILLCVMLPLMNIMSAIG